MAQQFLQAAKIGTACQQMRCKTVPQCMWRGSFAKAGTFANMVAVPAFLGSHSTLSYARQLGWLAWIAVVPGLVFSYIAAALYVPIARRALTEGRSRPGAGRPRGAAVRARPGRRAG